jgi:transcriptional regulator with XRE-family HTH domain
MWLKDWLTKEGKSQAEFAAMSGIGESLLSKYLSGDRKPSISRALKIKEATKGEVSLPDWPEEVKSKEPKVAYIYFARDVASGCIKIGRTKNHPQLRLGAGQTFNPNEIQLLGYFQGVPEDEKDLHKKFEGSRTFREWFKETPELLEFIAEACNHQAMREHSPSRHVVVRVDEATAQEIKYTCLLEGCSAGQLVERALKQWMLSHSKLQLEVHSGMAVLSEAIDGIVRIKEMRVMNGVPAKELAEQYTVQYQRPITLVEDVP